MAGLLVVVRKNGFPLAAQRFSPVVRQEKQAAIQQGVTVAKAHARVSSISKPGYIHMRDAIRGVENGMVCASDHAIYNEYGTYKMSAQPFMRPGADAMQQQFLAQMNGLEAKLL